MRYPSTTIVLLVHNSVKDILEYLLPVTTLRRFFLRFGKFPPQTSTKLTKTCGSEFDALLWRHPTPKRNNALWVHNGCNMGPCRAQQTFGANALVRSVPVFDYHFDNSCQ